MQIDHRTSYGSMRLASCATLLASSSLLCIVAFGTAAAQESTLLPPIVVNSDLEGQTGWGPADGFVATRTLTGTKTDTPLIETPQSISVVTKEQIEKQGIRSIGGTLRYTSGVIGEWTGAGDTRYGGIQIRGFDATSTALFRDGLRLPSTSATNFFSLDPYGAERIEVFKGPSSVLYGQNGPGGFINYVSKRPTDEPLREVSLTGGDFDRFGGQFDLSGPIDNDGTWLYRLTGLARKGGSQVDYVDDDRFFIAPALTWQPDADTSLTLLANFQRDRAGWGLQFLPASGTVFDNNGRTISRNRFLGEPDFDYYNTDQASVGYLFEHAFNDRITLRQNARYSYLKNEQALVYGGGYVDEAAGLLARYSNDGRSELHTVGIDNQAEVELETGPLAHTLLLGLDYRWTRYEDRADFYNADPIDVFTPVYGGDVTFGGHSSDAETHQRQTGIYLQDQVKLGRLSLVLGGRLDWARTALENRLTVTGANRSDTAFTGKAGVIYNFDNGFAPYISYSESFLPPLEIDADGNLFEPETGRQYEAGIKYEPPGWNTIFTLAAFDLARDNAIRYDAVSGTFEPRQTGEITSRGLEFEAVASLTHNIDLRAAYTYLDAEITRDPDGGNEGNRPVNVPEHTASLWSNYTIRSGAFEGLGLGTGIRYVGSSYGDDANTFKVPGAVLVDAAMSFERGNYTLAVNVSNLFDKRYVASCFNANFGCFYGEGRKITGLMTYRW